ncbi:MAG: NAD(P)/FAD-dependent oxidoreductase [Thermodesulfobacteriota bacterium]
MKQWDAIIVGAGIAGLGVGAILAREKGLEVLVLERHSRPGGRLMTFPDYPEKGWTVDVGLHLIELGDQGEAHRLNERVGKEPKWGPMSETVQLFQNGKWISIADLIQVAPEDQPLFRDLTKKIVGLSDEEIAAWDGRSFQEWIEEHTAPGPLRELLATFAMIMTTIPLPLDMAAGEVLYISRENLIRRRQLLSAGYPIGGMSGLTKGLVEVINESGGEVRTASRVQEVILEKDKAVGVMVAYGESPYPHNFRLHESETLNARAVVCALPIYQVPDILDFSALPLWWGTRIHQISNEVTGLVGYMIGLSEPMTDKLCFYSLLETPRARLPFQAFPASNFDPGVAPPGKQLFHTDLVCEYDVAAHPLKRRRLLELLREDLGLLFPEMEDLVAWRLPYYVAGCDGLARKPGLVGRFKPELRAPGLRNLYFAGDTYQGRGLATNSAAKSAMNCADRVMEDLD